MRRIVATTLVGGIFVVIALILSVLSSPGQERRHDPVYRPGHTCPTGYRPSGSYCVPNAPTSKPAINRPPGGTCPTGWRESADHCVKN